MIDCDEKAPKDNIRNAIILKKWEGDPADRTLFDLIPFLQSKYCVAFIQLPRYNGLRQIIDLRDAGKSRYFAIIEINNCFIIRSPSLLSYFNYFLAAAWKRSASSNYARAEYYLQSKTRLDGTMHEQTIICRQLFAGHVVSSRPMERNEKSIEC